MALHRQHRAGAEPQHLTRLWRLKPKLVALLVQVPRPGRQPAGHLQVAVELLALQHYVNTTPPRRVAAGRACTARAAVGGAGWAAAVGRAVHE